jgi:hypothetical protein
MYESLFNSETGNPWDCSATSLKRECTAVVAKAADDDTRNCRRFMGITPDKVPHVRIDAVRSRTGTSMLPRPGATCFEPQ